MRFSTELVVNLSHLAENFESLKKIAPGNDIIFMVKADAYGHGLLEIVYFACVELGIKRFGCASLGEAIKIRETLPELECELWVFSDTSFEIENCREHYLNDNIVPVITSLEILKQVLSDKNFNQLPLVIKFDTGMNRLGVKESELGRLLELLNQYERKNLFHVMTHFSCSYLKFKENSKTDKQLKSFKEILKKLDQSDITYQETSVSNSGAIEQKIGLEFTHIRPGLMLFGPASTASWKGKTISTFKTQVISLNEVKRGTPVGYGGHVCHQNGHIALLPVGYGDGIFTYYSGVKFVRNEVSMQVIGRVNMDMTAIFMEELPANFQTGSEFIFWDSQEFDINELAKQLKTIPYQLFIALTARVPRRYMK